MSKIRSKSIYYADCAEYLGDWFTIYFGSNHFQADFKVHASDMKTATNVSFSSLCHCAGNQITTK